MLGTIHSLIELFFYHSMQKEARQRPKYSKLMEHPFLIRSQSEQVDVSAYVTNIFQRIETLGLTVSDLGFDWPFKGTNKIPVWSKDIGT